MKQPTPRTLSELEGVIERGLQTFIEVGQALLEIRERRLYKADFATFEQYCRERWGWSKTHANRQIEAAGVAANLTPIGVTPKNEAQARELVRLLPAQQQAVASQINFKTATAADIRAQVATTISPPITRRAEAGKRKPHRPAQRAEPPPKEHFDAERAYQTIQAMIEDCPEKHRAKFLWQLYAATNPSIWQWLKPGYVLIVNNQTAFIASPGQKEARKVKCPFGAGDLIMEAIECLISELSIQQRDALRKKKW
jgi:hypothetical protein